MKLLPLLALGKAEIFLSRRNFSAFYLEIILKFRSACEDQLTGESVKSFFVHRYFSGLDQLHQGAEALSILCSIYLSLLNNGHGKQK